MILNIKNIERVVLLGGGESLRKICLSLKSKGVPISVVTSPRHGDEESHNGECLRDFLEKQNISFIITEDISSNEVEKFIGNTDDAFCLSISAAWIFKEQLISSLFKGRLFNSHGTRLPQNRGGGGFSWQIIMGVRFGFCQIHLIDSGVDTGDIVRTKEFLYPSDCRIPADYAKVALEKNYNFLLGFIEEIRQGGVVIETIKQSEYFSSYWPRLDTSINGWIDWDIRVRELERFVCAFDDPYAGAKSYIDDEKLFIKKVSVDYSDGNFHSFQAGIVYRKNDDWLCVCSQGGTLIIEALVNEDGEDYIKKVKVGDRFYTPPQILNKRASRIVYTPSGIK
jgi:methionyl-tRNA formyltransferase